MDNINIGPARPPFNFDDEPINSKKCERLIAGCTSSGMIIDVTKDGMMINGYYTGFQGDYKYAILRDGIVIPWEEVDKIRERILKPAKKFSSNFDRTEEEIDIEYLKSLPIVHINKKRYYIDSEKRERRAVDRPSEVWKF